MDRDSKGKHGFHEYVGLYSSILKELGDRFPLFLEKNLQSNPMKCEYFLPSVVGELLAEDKATVEVLKSMDKWYGVTYKEDKPVVVAAIRTLKESGLYPEKLWEEVTSERRGLIRREVIENFAFRESWWRRFHTAADI